MIVRVSHLDIFFFINFYTVFVKSVHLYVICVLHPKKFTQSDTDNCFERLNINYYKTIQSYEAKGVIINSHSITLIPDGTSSQCTFDIIT